jgi:hypothetical protein
MNQSIEPAVLEPKSSVFQYHIPICDRCEPVNKPVASARSTQILERKIYGCPDENQQGLVTISNRYLVYIKELLYPGNKADCIEVENKWLYVFKDNELMAEVNAVKRGCWQGYTKINGRKKLLKPANAGGLGELELDPGPKGARYSYYFFLSSVQLTPDAIDDFLSDKNHTICMASLECNSWGPQLLVPDAYRWAVDAHSDYLKDKLAKCLDYQADKDRAAQLFIASTLKAWIGTDNKLGVKNELQDGQPDKFLDDYKKQLNDLWLKAEEAAAYLAHCVESREFRAITKACMQSGDQALSTAYQVFALITDQTAQTRAGRVLAMRMLSDEQSLASKYLFHAPAAKPANQIDFKSHRWGHLAAARAYENLMPQFIDLLADKGKVTNEDLMKYLDNIGLQAKLKGTYKTIHENLNRGRSITAGINDAAQKNRTRKSYQKLMASENIRVVVPNKYDTGAKSIDHVVKDYEPVFKAVKFSVTTFFEVANFCLAVADYRRTENIATQEEFFKKISLVGSASDLTVHVLDCMEDLIMGEAPKRTIQGAAAAVSIVASVCDMVQFERNTLQAAFGEYDYGKAFGHGVQTLGAAGAVYYASVTLAAGLGASVTTGGLSLIIGVIGAALMFAGSLLAVWLSKNFNEKFAQFCFLGNNHKDGPTEQLWTEIDMPSFSIKDEVISLLALLSQFSLKSFSGINDQRLIITPGYLEKDSVFEIKVTETHLNLNSVYPTVEYTVKVFLDSDEIVITDGDYELKKESVVRRNEDGSIESIFINLTGTANEPFKQLDKVIAKVKLIVNSKGTKKGIEVPKEGNWSQIEVLRDLDVISSLNKDRWK